MPNNNNDNKEKKKVYLVSSGHYSDYGIEAVFFTKERAEEYINKSLEYSGNLDRDHYDIEEYDLDPEIKLPHNHKFKYFFYVEMDKQGNVLQAGKSSLDVLDPDSERQRISFSIEREYNHTTWVQSNAYTTLWGIINANDLDHAIKIMGEKRTKLLAENRWIDDTNDITLLYKDIDI